MNESGLTPASTIAALISSDYSFLDTRDEYGRSPLHISSLNDDADAVSYLLKHGADPNVQDSYGNTPMHNCARQNAQRVARLLLSYGASINIQSKNSETPIGMACSSGHSSMVQFFVDNSADVNLRGEGGWTPLHSACEKKRKNTLEIVKMLIGAGADPNIFNDEHQKACDLIEDSTIKSYLFKAQQMMNAEKVQQESEVKAFKPKHSMDSCCDSLGRNELHLAVLEGRMADIERLSASNPFQLSTQDMYGNTPLHYAAYHNSKDIVPILLRCESSATAIPLRSLEGDSALDYACTLGHIDIVKLLVPAGADVNAFDQRGWAPLHNACSKLHRHSLSLVQYLLAAGAGPSQRNHAGQLPFDITGNAAIKQILLDAASVEPTHVPIVNAASVATGPDGSEQIFLVEGVYEHPYSEDNDDEFF